MALPGCPSRCGNVSISYPFGIGRGCFLQHDFEVTCDDNGQAYTNNYFSDEGNISMKVLEISLLTGEVRVQNSIMGLAWSCNYTDNRTDIKDGSLALKDSMRFSTKNKFTAVGCAALATIDGPIVSATTMDDILHEYYYATMPAHVRHTVIATIASVGMLRAMAWVVVRLLFQET